MHPLGGAAPSLFVSLFVICDLYSIDDEDGPGIYKVDPAGNVWSFKVCQRVFGSFVGVICNSDLCRLLLEATRPRRRQTH